MAGVSNTSNKLNVHLAEPGLELHGLDHSGERRTVNHYPTHYPTQHPTHYPTQHPIKVGYADQPQSKIRLRVMNQQHDQFKYLYNMSLKQMIIDRTIRCMIPNIHILT